MAELLRGLKSDWKKNSLKENLYLICGFFFLLFAIVGIFLPLVPQVPFAIVAGLFFAKGSAHLHKWLRSNKYLGKPVKDWEDHRVVRPKLKAFSCVAMVVGALIGHWKLLLHWAIILDAIFLACIVFVVSRKSEP